MHETDRPIPVPARLGRESSCAVRRREPRHQLADTNRVAGFKAAIRRHACRDQPAPAQANVARDVQVVCGRRAHLVAVAQEYGVQMAALQTVFIEYNKELQKKQGQLTQPIVQRVMGIIRSELDVDGSIVDDVKGQSSSSSVSTKPTSPRAAAS